MIDCRIVHFFRLIEAVHTVCHKNDAYVLTIVSLLKKIKVIIWKNENADGI